MHGVTRKQIRKTEEDSYRWSSRPNRITREWLSWASWSSLFFSWPLSLIGSLPLLSCRQHRDPDQTNFLHVALAIYMSQKWVYKFIKTTSDTEIFRRLPLLIGSKKFIWRSTSILCLFTLNIFIRVQFEHWKQNVLFRHIMQTQCRLVNHLFRFLLLNIVYIVMDIFVHS